MIRQGRPVWSAFSISNQREKAFSNFAITKCVGKRSTWQTERTKTKSLLGGKKRSVKHSYQNEREKMERQKVKAPHFSHRVNICRDSGFRRGSQCQAAVQFSSMRTEKDRLAWQLPPESDKRPRIAPGHFRIFFFFQFCSGRADIPAKKKRLDNRGTKNQSPNLSAV